MDAYDLAKAFSEELAATLTAEQMDAVNERNTSETDKNICHSHDFCDANQVMLDAMASLGREWDNCDEDNAMVTDAWNIAKNAEFSTHSINIDRREMDAR